MTGRYCVEPAIAIDRGLINEGEASFGVYGINCNSGQHNGVYMRSFTRAQTAGVVDCRVHLSRAVLRGQDRGSPRRQGRACDRGGVYKLSLIHI